MHISSFIIADKKRLKQVLLILIGNSIKFTSKGNISVCIETDKLKQTVKIGVIDSGNGIKQEHMANIFDPFSSVEYKNMNIQTGIGMNLYLCKKIMEAMGGNITASSKEGSGSMFVIRMPLKISMPLNMNSFEMVPSKSMGIITARKGNNKVLLVDDCMFNCSVLQKLLKSYNFIFDIALNGKEASEMVSKNEYFIIFMDINMPIMNGVDATKEIRKNECAKRKKNIIIAVTAQEQSFIPKELFDEIFYKPIKSNELRKLVQKYIQESAIDCIIKNS